VQQMSVLAREKGMFHYVVTFDWDQIVGVYPTEGEALMAAMAKVKKVTEDHEPCEENCTFMAWVEAWKGKKHVNRVRVEYSSLTSSFTVSIVHPITIKEAMDV
jgi:hypothetical protein